MDLKTALLYGYQTARATHFAGQQLTLPLFERLATGKRREPPPDLQKKRQEIFAELRKLLKADSENIARGVYPLDVLKPESPLEHWGRFGRIVLDGWKISRRKDTRDAHDFEESIKDIVAETPEYYRRNFHYQTGGYFTDESADLYEHQVEILFAGGGDAMRRSIIPMFKEKLPGDGEGLHFLEIAAGTGRLSRFMKLAYPKARVTVSDLSWAYLKQARKKLSDLDRVEFVRAAAENLPFRDGMFDGVFSCFLFHELPADVRAAVVREGVRVLKPAGVYGAVDSLQMHDPTPFGWALERFPVDFHEPFYRNYSLNPLEELFARETLTATQVKTAFLSKAVVGEKSR